MLQESSDVPGLNLHNRSIGRPMPGSAMRNVCERTDSWPRVVHLEAMHGMDSPMTHPTHSVASNAEPAALSESGQVDRHKAPEGGRHEPLVSPLPFEATLSGDVEKNDTLALVAHELRDPLGAISAALVLLDRRLGRECVRERAIIRRQVDTLVRLVEDLLDATRIARDGVSLHREYVPLRDVLARALEITAPLRHTSHHRLHARLPSAAVLVYADSMRLAQVFSNLLSNAARFTPQGGQLPRTHQGRWTGHRTRCTAPCLRALLPGDTERGRNASRPRAGPGLRESGHRAARWDRDGSKRRPRPWKRVLGTVALVEHQSIDGRVQMKTPTMKAFI
jgi:hypothetical protein